jgi:sec-independent protein translocase protein TatA
MTTGIFGSLFGPDGLIILAVVVVVLLFGGSRVPKLARGLGSASHEFRKGLAEGDKTATPAGDPTKESSGN